MTGTSPSTYGMWYQNITLIYNIRFKIQIESREDPTPSGYLH